MNGIRLSLAFNASSTTAPKKIRRRILSSILWAIAPLAFTPAISSAQTPKLTVLHSFSNTDGNAPYTRMVQASDGNFYGTTDYGSTSDYGTLFRITSTGVFTTFYSFGQPATDSPGVHPIGGLVQGTDGSLYGTTLFGGTLPGRTTPGYGAIYKITLNGQLSRIYTFDTTSFHAPYTLIQANDGNFYGTTLGGGSNTRGSVFQMTPAGSISTIHSFNNNTSDSVYPIAPLLQASDGNFYGITYLGGDSSVTNSGGGLIFKLTSSGTYTVLRYFAKDNTTTGSYPRCPLVEGPNNTFYGMTTQGGQFGGGLIFTINASGVYSPIYSFPNGIRGAWLSKGSDGLFYGTTYATDDLQNHGTIFSMTANGVVTTLHTFNGTDGTNPSSGVIEGTDGKLYGTTSDGGTSNYGVVFKLTVPAAAPTGVSAAGRLTQVTLQWNASRLASTYNIYRSASAGTAFSTTPIQTGVSGTTAVISGLPLGQKHYFIVAGVNEAGIGSPSQEISATTITEDDEDKGGGGALTSFWLLALAMTLLSRSPHARV